jgi:hypothetical protein
MSYFPGASDCSYGETGHLPAASCRAFLTDTPWSAAFVSFVMNRAGLPGFNASASHIDFIREAYGNPGSPYAFNDPEATAPSAGDLLCFRRNGTPIGSQGLREILASGSADGMNMHCDIVVAASPGEGKLYLVGGNVLQGVTAQEQQSGRLSAGQRSRLQFQPPGLGGAAEVEAAAGAERTVATARHIAAAAVLHAVSAPHAGQHETMPGTGAPCGHAAGFKRAISTPAIDSWGCRRDQTARSTPTPTALRRGFARGSIWTWSTALQ